MLQQHATGRKLRPAASHSRPLDDAEAEAERAHCADDLLYWVNTYCRTYDPREADPFLPFKLFPRQEEFLVWLRGRDVRQEDGLAEKARDVGFTWLCTTYAVHGWLFRRGFAAGFGSRKLDLVDRLGDLDSVLEKARFQIEAQPRWMLPKGFRREEHLGFCNLRNPESGASITGEGGDQIGRGGRKTIYFVDEHAFLARAKRVEAALSQTSRCKIRVSTPNGTGNIFHTLRFGGKIPVFTFRWQDDPRKDEAWYRRQCEILDAVTVAQEIDIDYTASMEGICIPARWVRAAVDVHLSRRWRAAFPDWEKDGRPAVRERADAVEPLRPRPYGAARSLVCGLDVAGGGKNRNVWTARRGCSVERIEQWQHLGPIRTALKAADLTEQSAATQLSYDGVGIGEGVTDAFDTVEREFHFVWLAIYGGNPATETMHPDGKTSRERYLNLRAELWMTMRARFERTYEFVELEIAHDPDEMISIPNHNDLIAQLSQPLMFRTLTDKVKIESKDDMKRRGIESPDYADSLAYTFAPEIGDWRGAAAAAQFSMERRQAATETGRIDIPHGTPRVW
jgi:hypothetical protein